MYKKISQLSFVIGLFFFIVSLILAATVFGNAAMNKINLYTGIVFFVFGLFMMFIKDNKTGPHN